MQVIDAAVVKVTVAGGAGFCCCCWCCIIVAAVAVLNGCASIIADAVAFVDTAVLDTGLPLLLCWAHSCHCDCCCVGTDVPLFRLWMGTELPMLQCGYRLDTVDVVVWT